MMSISSGAWVNPEDSRVVDSHPDVRNDSETVKNDSPAIPESHQESLRCFVCDSRVQGRRYSLATCKTHSSYSRIIEKLGELVGERYVVVISEDDVICRSCANLMNTMDRLESEIKDVKAAVLRFLERKYSLAEGELRVSSEAAKPCQPPQITRSDSRGGCYRARKRGQVSETEADIPAKIDKKPVWMQCNKCRYTTHYDTFMAHHIKKERIRCDKCGVDFAGSKSATHRCTANSNNDDDSATIEDVMKTADPKAAEIAVPQILNPPETTEEVDASVALPIFTIQPDLGSSIIAKNEPIQFINLDNQTFQQFQSVLANDGSLRGAQPTTFMRVLQQFGIGEDYVQSSMIPTSSSDGSRMVKAKDTSVKQMLTLAADGSLEVVAVDSWDNINPQEPDIAF